MDVLELPVIHSEFVSGCSNHNRAIFDIFLRTQSFRSFHFVLKFTLKKKRGIYKYLKSSSRGQNEDLHH